MLAVNLGRLNGRIIELRRGSEAERKSHHTERQALDARLKESETLQSTLHAQLNQFEADRSEAEARHRADREYARKHFEQLSHLELHGTALSERIDAWDRKMQESAAMAGGMRADLNEIKKEVVSKNVQKLYDDLLHPSVQINARDAVGGGTLIHTEKTTDGWNVVHILTAYHVIQKSIPSTRTGKAHPIEARLYREDGSALGDFDAKLVSYSDVRDIALLRVRLKEEVKMMARMATREFLNGVRVFTPVYAVGCPLGHDPTPSLGEISSLRKRVNGENFWMVNAPTIFGNSGGGIFHRRTHELIGISAMICTYDNLVSTPVPHLSIVVSLSTVYDWLDEQNLQKLYDPTYTKAKGAEASPKAAEGNSVVKVDY